MADEFARLLRRKREFQVGLAAAGDTKPATTVLGADLRAPGFSTKVHAMRS